MLVNLAEEPDQRGVVKVEQTCASTAISLADDDDDGMAPEAHIGGRDSSRVLITASLSSTCALKGLREGENAEKRMTERKPPWKKNVRGRDIDLDSWSEAGGQI